MGDEIEIYHHVTGPRADCIIDAYAISTGSP